MHELFLLFYIIVSYPIVMASLVALVVAIIVSRAIVKKRARHQRIEATNRLIDKNVIEKEQQRIILTGRFGSELAERILNHQIWQGMTQEQLVECLGKPDAVDSVVTKTTAKENWKYDAYSARVTLETGLVVGWHSH